MVVFGIIETAAYWARALPSVPLYVGQATLIGKRKEVPKSLWYGISSTFCVDDRERGSLVVFVMAPSPKAAYLRRRRADPEPCGGHCFARCWYSQNLLAPRAIQRYWM